MVATAQIPQNSPMQVAARCRGEPIVLDGVLPELCPALEQLVLHRMQTSRQSTKSLNVGGWKSGEDFFLWPDAAVQQLRQLIGDQLSTSRLVGWAMVNRAGSHHPRHQHRAAIVTGVYYVTTGSEDAITPTIFECEDFQQRDRRGKPATYELEVEPHPGRLVICRGDAWHRVPPYPGELPRITVAFDVRR